MHIFLVLFWAALSVPLAIFLTLKIPQYIELQDRLTKKKVKIHYKLNPLFRKYTSLFLCVFSILIPLFFSYILPLNFKTYLMMFFCWAVLLLIVIDFISLYLPDILTLPMIWLGLIKELFTPSQIIGLQNAVFGAVVGYIFLRLLSGIYFLVTKKEPLGRGDMKFFSMIGAWFGVGAIGFSLIVSSVLLSLWHLATLLFLKKKNTHNYLPYGPWIGFSIYIFLIFNH